MTSASIVPNSGGISEMSYADTAQKSSEYPE